MLTKAEQEDKQALLDLLQYLWAAVRDGRADAVLIAAHVDGRNASFSVGDTQARALALGYLAAREVMR